MTQKKPRRRSVECDMKARGIKMNLSGKMEGSERAISFKTQRNIVLDFALRKSYSVFTMCLVLNLLENVPSALTVLNILIKVKVKLSLCFN
jgi:hypothetical protein